ncbi:hypothetical protein LshimejAT787_0600440 [Lyophyllum shimeji]|uniref:Uncharacterized protein n=1 Tax=Lyophyllum shimeji TaxID=47721 RepID=A0A9P3PP70_LYOSH|nr:hypothetical protein LshimejAT787_0600440 [Lyophyllum shimeji]
MSYTEAFSSAQSELHSLSGGQRHNAEYLIEGRACCRARRALRGGRVATSVHSTLPVFRKGLVALLTLSHRTGSQRQYYAGVVTASTVSAYAAGEQKIANDLGESAVPREHEIQAFSTTF